MQPDQRVVVQMPLTEIWNSTGVVRTSKRRAVGAADIKTLLRQGPIWFVIANLGDLLEWVPLCDRYSRWKTEIKDHLVEPETDRIYLDDYPDGYCYTASEWEAVDDHPIILLTMHH